jgi:hypothetical protein
VTPYHFDQSLIWHVVFHPGPCFWGKYQHVSLAGYADETWLHLDVQRGGVSVATIHRFDEVTDFLSFLLAHYTVLKFGPQRGVSRQFFQPMTCVSFVKHVLGIRSSALRPDGLLLSLERDFGAVRVNEPAKTAKAAEGADSGADEERPA